MKNRKDSKEGGKTVGKMWKSRTGSGRAVDESAGKRQQMRNGGM
ncbi:hypothetical protein [Parablautia sp. Marseille-Q6255]|nr:hypothetical protein [Parablautia sp. Marseille-Q6255]